MVIQTHAATFSGATGRINAMTAYYTLMSSLPRHGRQFKLKQTPISRIQLEKRLAFLSKEEQSILYLLEAVVWNHWFSYSIPLSETLKQAHQLLSTRNLFIDEVIRVYFDIRSLLAALRLRKMQSSPPKNPEDYWCTRWSRRLMNSWNEPDFGLKSVYPWLLEMNRQLSEDRPDVVENRVLTQLWIQLSRMEDRHYFDFEAVIIYLLRWNIVHYWSQFDEAKALERINKLADQMILDSLPFEL